MKTFLIKRKFLTSQNFLSALVVSTFFFFFPENGSKTSNSETFVSKKNSIVLSAIRSFKAQMQEGAAATTGTSSIFSRILGGIGSFFAVVGSGIATGITSTVLFLSQVIAFPVTATLSLFTSRNQATGTAGSTDTAGDSRKT